MTSNLLDFKNPKIAPLARLRLTEPQARLMRELPIAGFWIVHDGRQLVTVDILTDWGLVVQGNRRVRIGSKIERLYPIVKLTDRGKVWQALQ